LANRAPDYRNRKAHARGEGFQAGIVISCRARRRLSEHRHCRHHYSNRGEKKQIEFSHFSVSPAEALTSDIIECQPATLEATPAVMISPASGIHRPSYNGAPARQTLVSKQNS
jgi:hypothetical protein